MKKLLLTTVALLMCVTFATAQSSIKLPYSKSIEQTNGKWGKWPAKSKSQKAEFNFVSILSVKLINAGTFDLQLDQGGSLVYTERVHYDDTKTKELRRKTSNNNITVYKYWDSKNYIWTDNISLKEIAISPNKWTTNPNAKIYIWWHDLGSAALYTPKP